jgi:hypothetical protein
VLVIGPNPEYVRDLPLVLADSVTNRDPVLADKSLSQNLSSLDAALGRLAVAHGAGYASIFRALCASGHCVTLANGAPVLFDMHHFTFEGASFLIQRLRVAGQFSDARR